MSSGLAMPTEDELAEMSHTELEQGSLLAYFLWQESERLGKPIAEYHQIYIAYDTEQKKRPPLPVNSSPIGDKR